MAESQIAGTPFTDQQMTFINQTVKVQLVCGVRLRLGLVSQALLRRQFDRLSTRRSPTCTTAPTDEAGVAVGNRVHVGTGYARLMVVTPTPARGRRPTRACVELLEDTTTNLERLDDPSWRTLLDATPAPADVPWMTDLVAR